MSKDLVLQRLILINSINKEGVIELNLDDHASFAGDSTNKTSLTHLVSLFHGESPSKLVQDGKISQSFIQDYFPDACSFVVLECNKRGKVFMIVLHASDQGSNICYRFIDQPFDMERFRDDLGRVVSGSNLDCHIQKRGEFCSSKIAELSDYRAIIQNTVSRNQDYRTLAANFSFTTNHDLAIFVLFVIWFWVMCVVWVFMD